MSSRWCSRTDETVQLAVDIEKKHGQRLPLLLRRFAAVGRKAVQYQIGPPGGGPIQVVGLSSKVTSLLQGWFGSRRTGACGDLPE
jgi:hypothetical protein